MASKGKAGVASKDQAGATAETAADAPTETGVTDQPNVAQSGEQVTGSAPTDEEAGSAPATDTAAEAGVTSQPDVAQSADQVTGSATTDEEVGSAPVTDTAAEAGVASQPDVAQSADQVTGDAAGVGQADIDAPASAADELGKSAAGPVGYIVRAHRDRGIWRAGRFWPPENVPVPAHEITAEQLDALRAEPLLSVLEVKE